MGSDLYSRNRMIVGQGRALPAKLPSCRQANQAAEVRVGRLRPVKDRGAFRQGAGSEAMAARRGELPVRLPAFFHIHDGYGVLHREGRVSVNASKCDEGYRTTHTPIAVELN